MGVFEEVLEWANSDRQCISEICDCKRAMRISGMSVILNCEEYYEVQKTPVRDRRAKLLKMRGVERL